MTMHWSLQKLINWKGYYRYEVFTAVTIKMFVLCCDVCRLVSSYQRFGKYADSIFRAEDWDYTNPYASQPRNTTLSYYRICHSFRYLVLSFSESRSMSISEVSAQGDPRTVTIFLSVVQLIQLLHSTSSPVIPAKYKIFHTGNGISSWLLGSMKCLPKPLYLNSAELYHSHRTYEDARSLRRADHSSRGGLPYV
jgi:hypothetical protein